MQCILNTYFPTKFADVQLKMCIITNNINRAYKGKTCVDILC